MKKVTTTGERVLDLHCLQRQDISGLGRTRVKFSKVLEWALSDHKGPENINSKHPVG